MADWLADSRAKLGLPPSDDYESPAPPSETDQALAGTVFDRRNMLTASDRLTRPPAAAPQSAWSRLKGAAGGMWDALNTPLWNPDTEALEQSALQDERPAMRALKGFGASVARTASGLTSPLGLASFASGPIGTGARTVLGAEQVGEGIPQVAEGLQHGDWRTGLKGVANTALGGVFLREPFARLREAGAPPPRPTAATPEGPHIPRDYGYQPGTVASEGPANPLEDLFAAQGAPFEERTPGRYVKREGPEWMPTADEQNLRTNPQTGQAFAGDSPTRWEPQIESVDWKGDFERFLSETRDRLRRESADALREPFELDSAGIEPLPAGAQPPRLDGQPADTSPTTRFYGGRAGVEDLFKDLLPADAGMDLANQAPLEQRLLPESARDWTAGRTPTAEEQATRASDITASNRTITPGEFLGNARLQGGPALAELEAMLGIEGAQQSGAQGGFDALAQDAFLSPRRRLQSPGESAAAPPVSEVPAASAGPDAPRGPGELPATGEGGLVATGSDPGLAPGGGPRAPRSRAADLDAQRDTDLLNELIADAQRQGYAGDPAELRAILDERVQTIKELSGELQDVGRNPDVLLRAIVKAGGIGAEGGYPGELAWLRENARTPDNLRGAFGTVGGVPGVFRKPMGEGSFRSQGLTLDQMLESLRQDPRFSHLETPSDLIEAIRGASNYDRAPWQVNLERDLKGMGVAPGREWWKTDVGDPDFDIAALERELGFDQPPQLTSEGRAAEPGDVGVPGLTVDGAEQRAAKPADDIVSGKPGLESPVLEDLLSTGEAQPRLPGAGRVRDADIVTPTFDAPFSLASEADTTTRELEQSLFEKGTPDVPPDDLSGVLREQRGPGDMPAPGMVRVYRVEPASGTPASENGSRGRWFTTDRHLAQSKYDRTAGAGVVKYLDVPETDLAQYKTAARMAGASQGEDLTRLLLPSGEANRAAIFSELPASEAPSARGAVSSNVRDFLVKQLGYSAEDVANMDPAEAVRIGKARVANPQRPAPAGPAPIATLAERGELPSMDNFDELRQARGQQRSAQVRGTAVNPQEPQIAEGPSPTTPRARLEAGERLTAREREQLGLPAETRPREATSLRAKGSSPRQIQQRVDRMQTWIENPTPENFARWVQEVEGQAERVNERQLKGGTGTEGQMPARTEGGEYLASDFGAIWGFLEKHPELARPVLQAAAGALAGALASPDDHELRGAMFGALVGAGLTPQAARLVNKQFNQLLTKTNVWDTLKRQAIGSMGGAVLGTASDDQDPVRGAMTGAALGFVGGTIAPNVRRQLRYGAMLSGQAQLTNVLGNVGAISSAVVERAVTGRTAEALQIVKATLDFPTIAKTAGKLAFNEPVYVSTSKLENMPATGMLSVPGRIMNAADAITRRIMERGGLRPDEANLYAYRNTPLSDLGQTVLDAQQRNGALKEVVPFAKTAINLAERGLERSPFGIYRLYSGMPAEQRAMVLGQISLGTAAILAGAAVGGDHPFLTALAGPYALPLAAGMAARSAYGARGQKPMSRVVQATLETIAHSVAPLSNLSDLMQPTRFAGRYVASYVPAIVRLFNPDTWTGTTRKTQGKGILAPAQARVPGLAQTMPTTQSRQQPPRVSPDDQLRELEQLLGAR